MPAFHPRPTVLPGSREGFLRLDMNWARGAVKSRTAQSKGGKQVKAGDFEELFIDLALSSGVRRRLLVTRLSVRAQGLFGISES